MYTFFLNGFYANYNPSFRQSVIDAVKYCNGTQADIDRLIALLKRQGYKVD